MTTSWTAIASVTVGSGGSSTIDFTSIPATYTDLFMQVSARNTTNNYWASIKFNNSTANFRIITIQGTGSSVSQNADNSGTYAMNPVASTMTANTFGSGGFYVTNYAGSTNKAFSFDATQENNSTESYWGVSAGLWSNTAAINQITLTSGGTAFAQYSTATLFGIKNT
jgi:hypothetical protein